MNCDGGAQLFTIVLKNVDNDPFCTARFNKTDPAVVTAMHLDFLKARK